MLISSEISTRVISNPDGVNVRNADAHLSSAYYTNFFRLGCIAWAGTALCHLDVENALSIQRLFDILRIEFRFEFRHGLE